MLACDHHCKCYWRGGGERHHTLSPTSVVEIHVAPKLLSSFSFWRAATLCKGACFFFLKNLLLFLLPDLNSLGSDCIGYK